MFPSQNGSSVTFMRSYPNAIPLSAAVVDRVANAIGERDYDRLYGNLGGYIEADARAIVRRSADRVLKYLREARALGAGAGSGAPLGGIAHAFNGSRQQAEQFIKLGFKLGFGGAMTEPRATRIRELAATLPLEAIVLETDAPDIPPAWLQRGRNSPAELPRIAALLAELRGMTGQELALATSSNARAVLPLLAAV